MCPLTHESMLAIALAIIASFIFGAIWYGPLFGKKWATLHGMKIPEDCKGMKPPVKSLLITLLGTILTVFALAYILGRYKPNCNFGMALGIFFGFSVPILLSEVAWQCKPWKLFFINAGFYLLNLQLIAAILTYIH